MTTPELKQDLLAAEAESPVIEPSRNTAVWVQIGVTVVGLILAAFVWFSGTAKSEAASATSQVAEDITEIKETMNTMNERLQEVCEWRASAQEILRQLQSQSERCQRHVERDERTWPKGPAI